jgi:hypothetical protein
MLDSRPCDFAVVGLIDGNCGGSKVRMDLTEGVA